MHTMNKHALIFFICFIATSAFGQTVDEIMNIFPDEHAVFLTYNRHVKIEMRNDQPYAETKNEVEILILNDKANGAYNKYKVYHSHFNELKEIEAYTKVPDGNRFKKIKISEIKTQSSPTSGIFYDDMKESVFDFPAFSKGAIGYVKHAEINKDPHLLSPFYFSSYMPMINVKLTVSCPSDMELKFTVKNDASNAIAYTENKRGGTKEYTFTANNMKRFERFGDAPRFSYYEPHVITQILTYDKGQKYLSSLDDLFKWNSSFLKDINKQPAPHIKQLVDSIVGAEKNEHVKAKKIYNWVQEHIKYVAFEEGLEGFVPRQAADVCTKRYGDCKDMASLLTEMLKEAGLKAYFTWIGTRDIPYKYTEVPLPIVDNHMIAAVNINNEWIFLDATDPSCIYGFPSDGIQSKEALIALDENTYKVINVPVVEAAKNIVTDSTFISLTPKGITGKSAVYYNGYFASGAYNALYYKDSVGERDYVKSRMGKASNKFILGNYAINRTGKRDGKLVISADFEVPDYGKKVGNEYYINLNLEKFYTTQVIDTAKRKIPVENDYLFTIDQYTILNIPDGYKVTYLPTNFSYGNHLIDLKITYKQDKNRIIAFQQLVGKTLMIQPAEFADWNKALKELFNQYKEQVVLEKL